MMVSIAHVWRSAQERLRPQMTGGQFDTWLRGAWLSRADEADGVAGVYVLCVPTSFAKNTIEVRFRTRIEAAISEVAGQPCSLRVVVATQGASMAASVRQPHGRAEYVDMSSHSATNAAPASRDARPVSAAYMAPQRAHSRRGAAMQSGPSLFEAVAPVAMVEHPIQTAQVAQVAQVAQAVVKEAQTMNEHPQAAPTPAKRIAPLARRRPGASAVAARGERVRVALGRDNERGRAASAPPTPAVAPPPTFSEAPAQQMSHAANGMGYAEASGIEWESSASALASTSQPEQKDGVVAMSGNQRQNQREQYDNFTHEQEYEEYADYGAAPAYDETRDGVRDAQREAATTATLRPSEPLMSPSGAGGIAPPRLNVRYTFNTFIVGRNNQLAQAASQAVAEAPGQAYNPLFLYGGVGLGKTHLLHAIGHTAVARNLVVLYVSSETFTNEIINAIRYRTTEEFRAKYRSVDVLLVDDIQFIAGKESTEEEFFHTFNSLHEMSKQIVICSDRPPKAIVSLEERLRSRFEWGLIADIQPPDLETRVAILRAKAEMQGRRVPDDVVTYVASRVQSNIRELEGTFNRLLAFAQLQRLPLTIDTAKAALSSLANDGRQRRVTVAEILEAVAEYYHTPVEAICGKQRDKHIAGPRHVAMYLMRQETEASLLEVGQALGGRDHSTVLHGCEKIGREINDNTNLRKEVLAIRQRLLG